MSRGPVAVLGAGCAGLAAGLSLVRRGFSVVLLEETSRVGGLAGGVSINQNIYEYGPHIFHTTDPVILAEVKDICRDVILPFEKSIKIKFLGKYFDFPLSVPDVIFKLPFKTVVKASLSLVGHFLVGMVAGKKALVNSEAVLKRYYGNTLYEIFFKSYIKKMWNIEPKDLSPAFAQQRIPRFDFLKFFSNLRDFVGIKSKKAVPTENYVERTEGEQFTTDQGFSLIAEKLSQEFVRLGGRIQLNCKVTQVSVLAAANRYKVRTESGAEYEVGSVVSTLPINKFPSMIEPALPDHIIKAASALSFLPIVFVGLLVNKKNVLPASFMYFRDKSFNRVTDLGRFKIKVKPEGATILVAEITCSPTDRFWLDAEYCKSQTIQELVSEGLLSRSDVLEAHVFRTDVGYPVYKLGYESHLQTVLSHLEGLANLYSIGRQGRFAYINTHVAMKMGFETAAQIDRASGI